MRCLAWLLAGPAIQRTDIDTRRIYLVGISNGAAVVANLVAVVDPTHVKGVISEGVTPIGLGFPDEIRVPVQLVFGELDNLGPQVRRWATWGNGQTLGASLGATDAARAESFKAMIDFIERNR